MAAFIVRCEDVSLEKIGPTSADSSLGEAPDASHRRRQDRANSNKNTHYQPVPVTNITIACR